MHDFFSLPAELRQLVYQELLVTDCAFRLGPYTLAALPAVPMCSCANCLVFPGHHGPYTHVTHHRLHTSILLTSRAIHQEAAPVLYGHNTFFLGPIGHKPTYSASFVDSIGPGNAALIRTLVAHSVYPQLMTRRYVERWLAALGLNLSRLKVLAVSFSEHAIDKILPSNGPPGIVPHHTLQSHPFIPLNVHPINMAALQLSMLGTNTGTTPTHHQLGLAGIQQLTIPGIGHLPQMQALTPPPPAVERYKAPIDEYQEAITKTIGWLEVKKKQDVSKLAFLENTDLRAGEQWLVYISPAAKRKMSDV